MAIIGIIAPNTKWYVFNRCGEPAVGGRFETFDTVTGAPRATYADSTLTIPNPTSIGIGSDGAVMARLFWKVGDAEHLYTIRTYDAAGNLIDDYPNYPQTGIEASGGGGGTITIVNDLVNFGRNEQFEFWARGTSFDTDTLPIGTTEIADDWYFTRSNTSATVTIQEYLFAAGSPDYPFSPAKALRYTITVAAADASSDISQRYESVQTLNNQIATVGIRAQTLSIGTTAQVSLVVTQNFGTGGSATVETVITSFTFDDAEDFYTFTFTVPNIAGNTIGTEGDDYLEIGFRANPNAIQDWIMTDYQFQSGNGSGIVFPYITINQQYVKSLPDRLRGYLPNQGTYIIGWSATENLHDFLESLAFTSTPFNKLIGWDFVTNPNQFGEVVDSVSLITNDDGNYIADQTILLSNGNNVVSKDSFIGEPLTLTVIAAATKFGIFQIIETINSFDMQQKIYSAMSQLESSSSTTFKMAILGWSGTVNMQLRDCVFDWNSAGVDPTLNAGWDYIGDVLTFTADATTTYVYNKLEAQQLDASSSFGLFIWHDSEDLGIGDEVKFYSASLVEGGNATAAQQLDFNAVLQQCQRYVQRSYKWDEVLAYGAINQNRSHILNPNYSLDGAPVNGVYPLVTITPNATLVGPGDSVYIPEQIQTIQFQVQMYDFPIISLFSPYTGAVNKYYSVIDYEGIGGQDDEADATILDFDTSNFAMILSKATLTNGGVDDEVESLPRSYINYFATSLVGV